MDDPLVTVGDRAFLRLNQRLEPWQLGPGEITVSTNGRMDRGVWQPRKAIESVSGVLQVLGDPIKLPFFLEDTAGGETISSAARASNVVTLTFGSHPFTVGESGYLGVESLTGTDDPNGVQYVTIASSTTITYSDTGVDETFGGTGKVRSVLDDADAAAILGSCLYSDPSSANAESIVVAANGAASQVDVATGTATSVAYPTGVDLTGETIDLIQAFDRVFLFRDGARALEWHPLNRQITAADRTSNVVSVVVENHGLVVGDSITVADLNFTGDDPNGTFTITGITDADTVTYASAGADEAFTVASDSLLTSGFNYVRGGTYTQPQVFEVTGTNVVVADGYVTLTVSGNTTIKTGDTVTLHQTTSDDWLDLVGRRFLVVSASSTSIEFYAPLPDSSTLGADTIDVGRDISIGGGFSHMPAPPWGVYHQRRMIVPYRYTVAGTQTTATYTDRDVRDELVISDILDPDTFDVLANQFRITAGVADFLVGFWPFYEDTLLVFNRNSIHGLFGLSGSLSDTSVRELTRELGCVARKSVAQHGAEIMFLSDDGVYSVSFIDEYNLRGVDVPLSEPIQPLIDRLNPTLASGAVGVYFANRYYLAVPLDSVAGAGDAMGNNSILIYNFLNQGWESVDTVADSRFKILNFHIARAGDRNDLYAVNDKGGVHKIESFDDDSDQIAVAPGESIDVIGVDWAFGTRQYDAGSPERKRWTRVQLQVESSNIASDGDLTFTTEDPDSAVNLEKLSDHVYQRAFLFANEDYSIRARTGGKRGHGASVGVSSGWGRPRIKSVAVEATTTNRSTISQS